mgnify:CR=1 FL=1
MMGYGNVLSYKLKVSSSALILLLVLSVSFHFAKDCTSVKMTQVKLNLDLFPSLTRRNSF